LVMPEDTEELALTLNGKKRKIKCSDFQIAMNSSCLEEKIINNLFSKFVKIADKWFEFIEISFLPDDMKEIYKTIIKNKLDLLINSK
ncbi:MAG: type II toxin-antitoxin system HipA family toxin, partial [Tannerellaceae bacterium]